VTTTRTPEQLQAECYQPIYHNSWALIIGINDYQHAPLLSYAKNDAEAVAEVLVEKFGFQENNITKLYDQAATAEKIRASYLRFASPELVGEEDRILVFFAGHGHTIAGNRGDVGYLVPVDGKVDDLSTLIRWDELTRNADLINAKHIMMIMDACFSGLIFTRALPQGQTRYLKSMVKRYSRQVLTAGKADETVADAGGPIPKHSIFTGHLIQALNGSAADEKGIITASMVMAYVARKVSCDPYSRQSPHYGHYEGDGDFVFQPPMQMESLSEKKIDEDILIAIPFFDEKKLISDHDQFLDQVKEYLADERYQIKLDTLVTQETRKALALQTKDAFPLNSSIFNDDDVHNRLQQYEKITENMLTICIALAHWGTGEQMVVLRKMISRYSDHIVTDYGYTVFLNMRWYPVSLMLYIGAISAIAADNYVNLAALFTAEVSNPQHGYGKQYCIMAAVEGMKQLDREEIFKKVFPKINYYAPRSEYMFKLIQPIVDDVIFLGESFESVFDKCEIFIALSYYYYSEAFRESGGWGPPGRFAWKYLDSGETALTDMINEAERMKDEWAPLKAGFFGGSYEKFRKVADGYIEFMKKLNWH